MRNPSKLPIRFFMIPQCDNSVESIKIMDYKVAKKLLGVMFTGDGKTTDEHTDWMAEKGKLGLTTSGAKAS